MLSIAANSAVKHVKYQTEFELNSSVAVSCITLRIAFKTAWIVTARLCSTLCKDSAFC